jgi:hypothetical protein
MFWHMCLLLIAGCSELVSGALLAALSVWATAPYTACRHHRFKRLHHISS